MRLRLSALLLSLLPALASAQSIRWEHGRWYDGRGFRERTFYSVDGILTERAPMKVDQVVDLKGRFLVPPFGDAHHHGIDGEEGLQEKLQQFLREGIFYVKNPNVIPDFLTPGVRKALNNPASVDVVFANGGFTAPGGHPTGLHAFLAQRGVFKGLGPADMEGRAYHSVATVQDLERVWPSALAGHPDFIKAFVLFTDLDPEGRKALRPDGKGLSPAVLAALVGKAHAAGLRVSAHIETARDFQVAVEAGVDEITHMPLPRQDVSPDLSAYRIPAAVAEAAARQGIVVVSTIKEPRRMSPQGPVKVPDDPKDLALEAENIGTLLKAGVPIAIGSDGISGQRPLVTAQEAALYLERNGLLDRAALLRAWTETTAATIFPKRRIGRLQEGYEASFLALDGNPLEDFRAVTRIALRVKQGKVLDLAPAPASKAEQGAMPAPRSVVVAG